jgi:arginyl-tRNA synthetase
LHYVRFACSRIDRILNRTDKFNDSIVNYSLLTLPIEKLILGSLSYFKCLLDNIACSYCVNWLNLYLTNLAKLFHTYYSTSTIINLKNIELSNQRYNLCKCVGYILKHGLALMNINVIE